MPDNARATVAGRVGEGYQRLGVLCGLVYLAVVTFALVSEEGHFRELEESQVLDIDNCREAPVPGRHEVRRAFLDAVERHPHALTAKRARGILIVIRPLDYAQQ